MNLHNFGQSLLESLRNSPYLRATETVCIHIAFSHKPPAESSLILNEEPHSVRWAQHGRVGDEAGMSKFASMLELG